MKVGMLAFPEMQLLDFVAPYDVFLSVPSFEVLIIAASDTPISGWNGVSFRAHTTFATAPKLDILFVPGGAGVTKVLGDVACIDFLARSGSDAAYVNSVCTGSLLLGEAGLLHGYRATTHWRYVDLLSRFGAIYESGRVVRGRNRITAGGITSGLDFALRLVATLAGDATAERVQLQLEYDPEPPFAGHPSKARKEIVELAVSESLEFFNQRERQLEQAIADRASRTVHLG